MPRRFVCVAVSFAFALAAVSFNPARADVLGLQNGGELRGELVADDDDGPQVELRTLSGARVTIDRRHVRSVAHRRLIFEDYEARARRAADTVDAQWELAEWCRENYLPAQRRTHLLHVVRLEPDHERARLLLGHVRRGDDWVSRDDMMHRQGYVKYKGEFVTPQERDILEQQEAQREAEKEWFKKVRLWYLWANGRNAQRREEGLQQLKALRDPAAVPALINFLDGNRDENWRTALVGILGRIPGERPVGVLTRLSLLDEDADVRAAAFDAIGPERHLLAVPQYVAELRSGHNLVVRRAGACLGRIGDAEVIPALIDALVTTHTYRVRVPTNEGTYSFNRDGSMSSGEFLIPPQIEMGLRTGQYPNGVIVVQPQKPVRTKVITVRRDHQNAEVLAALNKLTGESYGYDENAWRAWWGARKLLPAG